MFVSPTFITLNLGGCFIKKKNQQKQKYTEGLLMLVTLKNINLRSKKRKINSQHYSILQTLLPDVRHYNQRNECLLTFFFLNIR